MAILSCLWPELPSGSSRAELDIWLGPHCVCPVLHWPGKYQWVTVQDLPFPRPRFWHLPAEANPIQASQTCQHQAIWSRDMQTLQHIPAAVVARLTRGAVTATAVQSVGWTTWAGSAQENLPPPHLRQWMATTEQVCVEFSVPTESEKNKGPATCLCSRHWIWHRSHGTLPTTHKAHSPETAGPSVAWEEVLFKAWTSVPDWVFATCCVCCKAGTCLCKEDDWPLRLQQTPYTKIPLSQPKNSNLTWSAWWHRMAA